MTEMRLIIGLLIMMMSISPKVEAQDSTRTAPSITLSGYTDVYFATFSNDLEPNAIQPFTTVSPRSDRFGLNVAQLSVAYAAERLRGTLTLHYGDIAEATWADPFRMIQEANVGLNLLGDWWLDAGFFTTHIGTESFLPKNNYLSSTTVATYNEPFYQSGARLSYEGSEVFSAQLHLISGYNLFLDVNDAKSAGVLLSYVPSDQFSVTYTNLLGRESLDDAPLRQIRFYQNLYVNATLFEKLLLTVGGDLGTQTHSQSDDPEATALMYNALATVRYQFTPQWSITTRGEVFEDSEGFISGTFTDQQGDPQGLQLWGVTLGAEYRPTENAYLRAEGRNLTTNRSLTIFDQGTDRSRWELMVTIGYYFDKVIH